MSSTLPYCSTTFYVLLTNHNVHMSMNDKAGPSRITCLYDEYECTCWHHVTNHLIISNDKDFNTEKQKRYMRP
jgi:hypothetical protein